MLKLRSSSLFDTSVGVIFVVEAVPGLRDQVEAARAAGQPVEIDGFPYLVKSTEQSDQNPSQMGILTGPFGTQGDA